MVALLVAGFVGLFSETALNIALGDLGSIFDVKSTTVQWLATGYFLHFRYFNTGNWYSDAKIYNKSNVLNIGYFITLVVQF